jgi:hypothetical protein
MQHTKHMAHEHNRKYARSAITYELALQTHQCNLAASLGLLTKLYAVVLTEAW